MDITDDELHTVGFVIGGFSTLFILSSRIKIDVRTSHVWLATTFPGASVPWFHDTVLGAPNDIL